MKLHANGMRLFYLLFKLCQVGTSIDQLYQAMLSMMEDDFEGNVSNTWIGDNKTNKHQNNSYIFLFLLYSSQTHPEGASSTTKTTGQSFFVHLLTDL